MKWTGVRSCIHAFKRFKKRTNRYSKRYKGDGQENLLTTAPPYEIEQAIKRLGANLRTARLRRNLTIAEVAERIGTGVRPVADAERSADVCREAGWVLGAGFTVRFRSFFAPYGAAVKE